MTNFELYRTAQIGAGAIAAITGATLLLRIYLSVQKTGDLTETLLNLSQYFTILTNAVVVIVMALIALGKHVPARMLLSLIVAIVCVGIIYHLLLANLAELSGLHLLADHGVHTIVPILCAAWWLMFAPRPSFRASDIGVWIAWPLAYVVYILVRAGFSGFYPYYFLRLPDIGWGRLAINLVGLSAVFVLVGLLLLVSARFVNVRGNTAKEPIG